MHKPIKELKDKFKGREFVVAGTGPHIGTISNDVMEHLNSEYITIGCNLVFRRFAPDYLVLGTIPRAVEIAETELDRLASELVVTDDVLTRTDAGKQLSEHRDIYVLLKQLDGHINDGYSWEFENRNEGIIINAGSTITAMCIPLALFMGARNIFVIGVDGTSDGHFYDTKQISGFPPPYWSEIQTNVLEQVISEGVGLFNCNPNNRSTIWPFKDLSAL